MYFQKYGQAWDHYQYAVLYHDEGWPSTTTHLLLQCRRCAYYVGRREEYVDLTVKLLPLLLRPSLGEERRRMMMVDLFYMLTGDTSITTLAPPPPPTTTTTTTTTLTSYGGGSGGFGQYKTQHQPLTRVDDSGINYDDPMVVVVGEVMEVHCGSGGSSSSSPSRLLISYSLHFKEKTCEQGTSALVVLRIISHLPLPLRFSTLELSFNQPFTGTITIHDSTTTTSTTTLLNDMTTTTPPSPPPSPIEVTSTTTTTLPLLLLPEMPYDIPLLLPIPWATHVGVGDMVYAVQARFSVDLQHLKREGE